MVDKNENTTITIEVTLKKHKVNFQYNLLSDRPDMVAREFVDEYNYDQ